jgi:acetyl-CoA carboxylase biotin carboxylase subunit
MIKKLLIANRGEVAVRIIRACQEMNIEAIAVYSKADRDSLHVNLASDAICIGPAPARHSYLNMDAIATAAEKVGADAVHPGYGFLSENGSFARLIRGSGMLYVGPEADAIDMMGNKSAAKKAMKENGVPVIPGSDGTLAGVEEAVSIASEVGFPVMLKAVSGGGGKGMRTARTEQELREAFSVASAEAKACFGDESLYLEKLISQARHIEVQVISDSYGNIVTLGERECSIQRMHQKIIEEAPSLSITDETRSRLMEIAVGAAAAVGYQNAGTVEFVLDGEGKAYFLEMNTRLQVEHPVTEMATGIDIVAEQIRIASGARLSIAQGDVKVFGHAIECRINAEDPQQGFASSPGKVDFLHFPGGPGVRVDSGLYSGCEISPYYDSMAAKLIVHAKNRKDAVMRMRRALGETHVSGVKTNLGLLYVVMHHPDFTKNRYDTGFIDKNLAELLQTAGRGML